MHNLPTNWQVKSLGEVVTDIRYGLTASADFLNAGIKFLRVTDITTNGSVNYKNLPNVVVKKNEAERYLLLDGDCVIARSGSVGKAHIFSGNEDVVFASYLIRLRFDHKMLSPQFFGAFSRTKLYWEQINSNTKGGVQQNINTEGLSRIKIPLPPLPIQKQIAEILEKADRTKQKRKEANKLTDEFLQSVFIEMFGDPVKNPKGWEVKKGNQLFDFASGKFNPTSNLDDSFPYPTYGGNGITGFSKDYLIEAKTIVIGRVGAYCGCVHITEKKSWVTDNAIYIKKFKEKVELNFLHFLFTNMKLNSFANYSGQPKITQAPLQELNLIFPPLSLQQQFAEIVNKTEALKENQKQSEQELENLFQSLMQRAFKGEFM